MLDSMIRILIFAINNNLRVFKLLHYEPPCINIRKHNSNKFRNDETFEQQ